MPLEVADTARNIAINSMESLCHPVFGLKAGVPRFDALFGRDIHRFIRLAFSRPQNLQIPGLLASSMLALDKLEETQATDLIPDWEAAPGKIIHQWMNGFTPPAVLEGLEKGGWPVFINSEGSNELRYFGGDDVTPGYIDTVAIVAQALAIIDSTKRRDEFLAKKFPSLEAAFCHQVNLADIDGDGLVESVPHNKKTLFHMTERDADNAYDLEDGSRPYPPFKYLGTNCLNAEAMGKMSWMATLAGKDDLAKEALEFHQTAKSRIRERFWDKGDFYPTSLIFGEGERADVVSDEPVDGLWYGIFDQEQARMIVDRVMQPDMLTPWGIRSRSSESRRFYANGAKAYWNGGVWTHRTAIAAEALNQYGFSAQAAILRACLKAVVIRKGCVEVTSVDMKNHLDAYREKKIPKACLPQLFAVGGVLALTTSLEL